MARTIENNGIGAVYATFEITKTGQSPDLSLSNVGDAVTLAGNSTTNHGFDNSKLLGRLEHVSGDLATVQVSGVVRLNVNTSSGIPFVGNAVVIDGTGKVYRALAIDPANGDPAGGNIARGTVLAVDATNDTCDVLL